MQSRNAFRKNRDLIIYDASFVRMNKRIESQKVDRDQYKNMNTKTE